MTHLSSKPSLTSEVTRHTVVTASCDLALQSVSSLPHPPCTPYKEWVQGWTPQPQVPTGPQSLAYCKEKGSPLQTLLVTADAR